MKSNLYSQVIGILGKPKEVFFNQRCFSDRLAEEIFAVNEIHDALGVFAETGVPLQIDLRTDGCTALPALALVDAKDRRQLLSSKRASLRKKGIKVRLLALFPETQELLGRF
jgi:hypothetical protein